MDKHAAEAATSRDHSFQALALEYEALRAEILMRSAARFQFAGFIAAAAALVGTGIGYASLGPKTWILCTLAAGVIFCGLVGFWRMGRYLVHISAHIAMIEGRINELAPAPPGTPPFISWHTDNQEYTLWGRVSLGVIFMRAKHRRMIREMSRIPVSPPSRPDHISGDQKADLGKP
jgi:hypothetical protein